MGFVRWGFQHIAQARAFCTLFFPTASCFLTQLSSEQWLQGNKSCCERGMNPLKGPSSIIGKKLTKVANGSIELQPLTLCHTKTFLTLLRKKPLELETS